MDVRWRWSARFTTALVITAVPVATSGFGTDLDPTAQTTVVARGVPDGAPSPDVDLTAIAPSVTAMQRHYLSRLPADQRPQVIAPQTTIEGGLALRTAAQRNRKIAVSSAKGGPVFTASSLAEHDLPSAAMRAYKNAARAADAAHPGCHLPWTLLAGIGRVESDHGRYGGSVLGSDGVPRPAIIGIALNGNGPVAAIRDTDNGRFDGDAVWDRAVGPMQFIPSTWRGAGRDGDHDGSANPNDIDDASLAAAGYLCHSGDLDSASARRSAIMSYNASDYYVSLVLAFERGYRTGVFVIPSPPVEPSAGDGTAHRTHPAKAAKAAHRAARAAARRAAKRAATAAARHHRRAVQHSTSGTPSRHHSSPPPPKPPAPKPPTYSYASGKLAAVGAAWAVGGRTFTTAGAGAAAVSDFDGDGHTESLAAELGGVLQRSGTVTIRFQVGSSPLKVVALSVSDLAAPPAQVTTQSAQVATATSPPSG